MKGNKGYTLVEIVVVLAIIGIISAITVPLMHKSFLQNMKSIQRKIGKDIRYAQEMAIYSKSTISVMFFKDKYIIRTSPTKPPILRVDLPSGISIMTNFNYDEIIFNAEGIPSRGGTIYLSRGTEVKEVRVSPVTGQINYYE